MQARRLRTDKNKTGYAPSLHGYLGLLDGVRPVSTKED